jgi:hypothetical protein
MPFVAFGTGTKGEAKEGCEEIRQEKELYIEMEIKRKM